MDKPIFYLKKTTDDLSKAVELSRDKESADIQGSYTDHFMSPYMRRDTFEPMHGDEAEAFSWAMNKVMEEDSSLTRMTDVIKAMEEENYVYVDMKGLLRVNPYHPYSNPETI